MGDRGYVPGDVSCATYEIERMKRKLSGLSEDLDCLLRIVKDLKPEKKES